MSAWRADEIADSKALALADAAEYDAERQDGQTARRPDESQIAYRRDGDNDRRSQAWAAAAAYDAEQDARDAGGAA